MKSVVTSIEDAKTVKKQQSSQSIPSENGTFTLKSDGVYFQGLGEKSEPLKICSPIKVIASTRDTNSCNWGRLLEWRDGDSVNHQWAMPMCLLAGDGSEVASELLQRGLVIMSGKKRKVLEYIQSCDRESKVTCTNKTGWHGKAFITPSKVYGADNHTYVFQSDYDSPVSLSSQGTQEQWRDNVAHYAAGNSRLVFAISAAFAGTLIEPAGIESGGFHFFGGSSAGKTTAQIVASSVWGNPNVFKRSWRATSNGLEGIASQHNDSILILDEMREASTKAVAEASYMLANGQGKTRANVTGAAKPAKTWKLLFLSSGEVTLSEILASEGKRTYAGQEVRIANINADAGQGMGMIEQLHDCTSAAGLADKLRYETALYYSMAGDAWLEKVTQNQATLWSTMPDKIQEFTDKVVPDGSGGQIQRVAKRFGLVAVAGELATDYGLTGWNKGESTTAAEACFISWLAEFGSGDKESQQILEAVRAFIERNGNMFQAQELAKYEPPTGMLGYVDRKPEKPEYYILPSQFARVIEGFNKKMAIGVLRESGLLIPGTDGKPTTQYRPQGRVNGKFYRVILT